MVGESREAGFCSHKNFIEDPENFESYMKDHSLDDLRALLTLDRLQEGEPDGAVFESKVVYGEKDGQVIKLSIFNGKFFIIEVSVEKTVDRLAREVELSPSQASAKVIETLYAVRHPLLAALKRALPEGWRR